jgi:hypothetical protein
VNQKKVYQIRSVTAKMNWMTAVLDSVVDGDSDQNDIIQDFVWET